MCRISVRTASAIVRPRKLPIRVYLWNTHVCGALYPLIGAVEISLRNAIDQALVADLGRFWWTSTKLRYRSFAPDADTPRSVQVMRENFAKATREYVAEQRRRHAARGNVMPHHHGGQDAIFDVGVVAGW